MNNITFKKKFLLFIIFSIIFAVFFLYIKHNVGNDSSISEWLINYNGGFTKRGIGGEIAIMIANLFELSLRQSIFFVQSLAHITYLVLIFFYLKNLKVNIIQVFAIYVPLFLLYPIAEIEVLARKETFVFISFLIFLNISNSNYSSNFSLYYVFFVLPIDFKDLKVLPSLNSTKYSDLFLNMFNFNFSDKALTTDTPTPWSPPDILYELLSNFPPACNCVIITSAADFFSPL